MRGQFSWFKDLFGFEESLSEVYALLRVEGESMHSLANDRRFRVGHFATPSLAELRTQALALLQAHRQAHSACDSACDSESEGVHRGAQALTHTHLATQDVLRLHGAHPLSLFQAASQFNCLEFSSPRAVPELGVEIYAMDFTQGPACALACAPAAVLRNYFVRFGGAADGDVHRCGSTAGADGTTEDCSGANTSATTTNTSITAATTADDAEEEHTHAHAHTHAYELLGQRRDRQIDNLDALARALNNAEHRFWETENGYVFSRGADHLARLNARLRALTTQERDRLRDLIKVGVHRDVQVVFSSKFKEISRSAEEEPLLVTQVYASALSCAYSGIANEHWEPLAQLVLDAMYEATLWAALCNYLRHGGRENSRDVFLTFLGGGVFGNDMRWIYSAMARAIAILARLNVPLRVHICHYRNIQRDAQREIDSMVAEEMKKPF